tara:strand:+ start:9401 stop:9568 length:168 start_codon:yes stop_codon:yes gene_type:complete
MINRYCQVHTARVNRRGRDLAATQGLNVQEQDMDIVYAAEKTSIALFDSLGLQDD